MKNTNLINIFRDTYRMTNDDYTKSMIEKTRVYQENELDFDVATNNNCTIKMVHGGTVSTAYAYADKYDRVAMLNFADDVRPGGLVDFGEVTQEENICRTTNLYRSLIKADCARDYYLYNRKFNREGSNRLIYTPQAKIFRDDETYEFIDERFADVITCPAPAVAMSDAYLYRVCTERIAHIVMSAIANGVDCLVLGAWGCGAFNQNPEIIAKAFAIVLNLYSGYFDSVIFAIRPTYSGSASDSTYKTFYNILSKYYDGEVIE